MISTFKPHLLWAGSMGRYWLFLGLDFPGPAATELGPVSCSMSSAAGTMVDLANTCGTSAPPATQLLLLGDSTVKICDVQFFLWENFYWHVKTNNRLQRFSYLLQTCPVSTIHHLYFISTNISCRNLPNFKVCYLSWKADDWTLNSTLIWMVKAH